MPLYDYECPKCKFKVELLMPSSDYEAEFCSKCGHLMERKFPAASYLEKRSETINITKKLANKMGSGDDHAHLPRGGPVIRPL